jgi:hypothetical protein
MGGFGYNQQKSKSSQQSGLRGTQYEGAAANQAYNQGMNATNFGNQMLSRPGAQLDYGQQMLPGGQYGLGQNVDRGVQALGDYSFGQASKSGAMRGQMSPENTQGVVGSAIQNMLPFLIPQLQNMQTQQFQAPQGLFNMAQQNADYWNRALGASGQSSGSGFGFSAHVEKPS